MSKVKPILFNTEMVRAILDERKTVTRRKVDIDISNQFEVECGGKTVLAYIDQETGDCFSPIEVCRYQPGDILYVRETWNNFEKGYSYKADWEANGIADIARWRPSIHMPKEAARIWLYVTNVRVERLQDIDDDGVVAEGLQIGDPFDELWDATIKKGNLDRYGWNANPWVWVIEFKRCEIMKCSELQPGDEVVFYIYIEGKERVYDGYVSYVCKIKKLVHVNYVEGYRGMSDIITYDKMVAKTDEAGEEMVFGGCIRGKSVLLIAE